VCDRKLLELLAGLGPKRRNLFQKIRRRVMDIETWVLLLFTLSDFSTSGF
jgi:hypothetical protein